MHTPEEKQVLISKLASWPAKDLAALLADLAQRDPGVDKAVESFLARADPKALIKALQSQISGLKRRSRYIEVHESGKVADQMHIILDSIERDLVPSEPLLALKALGLFIATDSKVLANADDSNGQIADTYHRACRLLAVASMAAGKPKEAEEVFLSLQDVCDYGSRDEMFDEAANILDRRALERIVAQWRFRAQSEDWKKFGGIRVRLAQVAESMGDPELFEEASLCGQPKEQYPLIAIDVARVYLKCGKAETALEKMPPEQGRFFPKHYAVLIGIHRALGNTQEVSEILWSEFERNPSGTSGQAYIDSMPEGEREQALSRMHELVLRGGFTPLRKAMYFAEMGDLATTAEVVVSANGQFNGEHYDPILGVIKLLGKGYPLAQTVLYRALMESLLERTASKYYPYAVRYAQKLAALAGSVEDWKSVIPHEDYWRVIAQKHARKSGFWSLMAEREKS